MALKAVVTDLSVLPEAVRGEYVRRDDGMFALQIDGTVPGWVTETQLTEQKNKVIEFRDNNVKLLRELGADSMDTALERAKLVREFTPEKLAKLRTIDPAEYERTKAKLAALEASGAGDPKDVQNLVSQALQKFTADVVNPIRGELETERKARAEAQDRLNQSRFRTVFAEVAHNAGAKPNAIDFLLSKAQEIFEPGDGGDPKAKQGQFSRTKPGEAITPEEWIGVAVRDYDFAFEKSGGSGATPPAGTKREGKTLIVPADGQADPLELGRHYQEIAEGKMKIVSR